MISVKEAVQAVNSFIADLFGQEQLTYSQLEEVEFFEDDGQWLVTMSFLSPTDAVMGRGKTAKEFKKFKVDGQTAAILSMRIAND